ncbi:MAG: histidine kinase [Bacteroidota bacterium]
MDILKKYEHWNWERLRRHLVYWLLWSVFFVLVNNWTGKKVSCDDPIIHLWQWIAFESVVLPIKLMSTYTIAYWLMPRFLYQKRYTTFFIIGLFTLLLFAALLYVVYSNVVHPLILADTGKYTIEQFVYKGIELVYIASLVVGIKFFQNYSHEQQRNQALMQQKVEAELKYLKNQIQPHFLFNTLNNIYGMVLSNDAHAGEAIVKLSALLSYMLYEGNTKTVPLSKEIDMLDSFVELELLRYRRKLDLNYTKKGLSPGLKIAPLLLVPFVENAFKHGPATEEGQSFINIQIEVQQQILHLLVENSYQEDDKKSDSLQSGIGLENIKKRLQLLYPDRHTLNIQKSDTFQVSLMIELKELSSS